MSRPPFAAAISFLTSSSRMAPRHRTGLLHPQPATTPHAPRPSEFQRKFGLTLHELDMRTAMRSAAADQHRLAHKMTRGWLKTDGHGQRLLLKVWRLCGVDCTATRNRGKHPTCRGALAMPTAATSNQLVSRAKHRPDRRRGGSRCRSDSRPARHLAPPRHPAQLSKGSLPLG